MNNKIEQDLDSSIANCISSSYQQARQKFLVAAKSLQCQLSYYKNTAASGIDGEALYCDIARLGNDQAEDTLIISSGTHGIEGYCGSALQLLMVEQLLPNIDLEHLQIIFVHGINPYGFSHGSRNNENNVDINRNFRSFDQMEQDNQASQNDYDHFRNYAFPTHWHKADYHSTLKQAQDFMQRIGIEEFQLMMTQGQYQWPCDPYFGGQSQSWSNQIWQQFCTSHLATANKILHIDLHTGLGPYGECEIIFTGDSSSQQYSRAKNLFPSGNVIAPGASDSVSPAISGALSNGLLKHRPDATCVAFEYGTIPIEPMLNTLIAATWLYSNPDCNTALKTSIQQQVREAFLIEDGVWIKQIWQTTQQLLHEAITQG